MPRPFQQYPSPSRPKFDPAGAETDGDGEDGRYLPPPEVARAVNVALATEQPILVTGAPGVGKTKLARSIADELAWPERLPLHRVVAKSDAIARDILYEYDHVGRLFAANNHDNRADRADDPAWLRFLGLGAAIVSGRRSVVLIDEIDKAPRDFPNDLLTEVERLAFRVPEVPLDVPRPPEEARPILVITSNGERDLPEPFLRRCVYCHIPTPDSETRLTDILLSRLAGRGAPPDLPPLLVRRFRALLADGAWKRRPGVAEMVAWARGIVSQVGMSAKLFGTLQPSDPEFCTEALAKTRDDVVRLTTKV